MGYRRVRSAAWLLASLSRARAAIHDVKVGDDGLSFSPDTLTAKGGDVINYSFHSGDHSVIQTSLEHPCEPLEDGFSSGFVPAEGTSPITFRVVLNETAPVYVYSGEEGSCSKGMLQVINPSSEGDGSLKEFKRAAGNATTKTPETNDPVGGQRILTIDVGKDGEHFTPSDATGQVSGTVIQFRFHPKNNSVVQASYDRPCQPLNNGFASGFIPIDSPSAGVDFSVVLNDTEPIYFYDAQTVGSHCQSGMVGSVNAPADGNTQESFASKARGTETSTHPDYAPQGGTLTVNSTIIPSLHGSVLHLSLLNSILLSTIPREGQIDQSITLRAGGGAPTFAYGKALSDSTTERLQLLQFADNILLETLVDGTTRLTGGEWKGVYPGTITAALETTAAQSYVQRAVSAFPLERFDKGIPLPCAYTLPLATVDDFISTVHALLLLEIGLYGDIVRTGEDTWVLPAVAGAMGSKARAAGLLNMMLNHTVGAAPGEVPLSSRLAYSYLSRYVGFCPEGDDASSGLAEKFQVLPRLLVSGRETTPDGGRVTKVAVQHGEKGKYMAWMGGYGEVQFTEVEDGVAEVPGEMYGHVWAVVTKEKDVELSELEGVAAAGPEMVWLGQP